MAIIVSNDVFCDWCSNWVEGHVSRRVRKRKAREVARAEGWKRRWSFSRQKYEDVCPQCLAKEIK